MYLFTLTMPNSNTWNGKNSMQGNLYAETRPDSCKAPVGNFYYNFGDGWGANVYVEKLPATEAHKRIKGSLGFNGYDWMIDEIIQHGRILNREERD